MDQVLGKMARVLWTEESPKIKDGIYLETKATVPSEMMGWRFKEFRLVKNPRRLQIPQKTELEESAEKKDSTEGRPSSAGCFCTGSLGAVAGNLSRGLRHPVTERKEACAKHFISQVYALQGLRS